MAEERLIDDDKDRKYKIRINENGEEELVIDDTPEEEEESDIPVFNIPVYDEDDEEAAVLTPEQLAERERVKQEEQASRTQKAQSLLEKAKAKLEENDYEGALYAVSQAKELEGGNGEVYCVMLKTLTRNFTDFLSYDACAEAADGVREYSSAEQKAELKELASGLKARIEEVEKTTAELSKQNEEGKEQRRSVFAADKKRTFKNLICAAVPFIVMLILAISFSTVMFSAENGTYIILTIVFAALAFIGFIITLFALNRFWTAKYKVKLNEKDSTTQIGRNYLQSNKELEQLKNIYSSFGDDIS